MSRWLPTLRVVLGGPNVELVVVGMPPPLVAASFKFVFESDTISVFGVPLLPPPPPPPSVNVAIIKFYG
jgi:hypothetical protein